MCGIACYKGNRDASKVVAKGLKKLEYRGYDSAGIATVGNPSIKIEKGKGTIEEVLKKEKLQKLDGNIGIGHNRWATHGKVNQKNAHPHTNHKEHERDIAVVHNGIIENHEQLKKEIGEKHFESETDTEVIPHLIQKFLEKTNNLKEVCRKVMSKLEGTFAAVAALDTGEKIAFRKGSPLVLGIGDNEHFLASDVTPFLEYTNKAIFLEDQDYVIIKDQHQIYNNGEKVQREIKEIDWNAEEASKQGYPHYMLKEIHQQSETVKRAAYQDKKDLKKAKNLIENAENIYITGCGTSSFAAELGAHYLRKTGKKVQVEQSHELEYRKNQINDNDLIIGISQSGETADLLSLLNKTEADILSIVNVVGSTLDRISDKTLYINAGPEIGVASTKAFTAQLTVLKLIQHTINQNIENGRKTLLNTADKIDKTIKQNQEEIEKTAEYLSDKEDAYFIGRNKGKYVAKEASLKLKEISYIHSESFPGGEFKHGTLALVEEETPVIGILTGKGKTETLTNLTEAKSRGADLIGIGQTTQAEFKHFLKIPESQNSEILETTICQLIAYKTALKRGKDINPDKPRNLAKSVTVK